MVRVWTYIAANAGVAKRTLDYLSFMVFGFLAGLVQRRIGRDCWHLAPVLYQLRRLDALGIPLAAVHLRIARPVAGIDQDRGRDA